jgi:protein-disulfide isomerase
MKRYLPFILIAAVLLVAIAAGVIFFQHRKQSRPTVALSNFGRPGAEPPHLRGSADAPVQLEEFGDFECEPCSMLWPILTDIEQEYGERLVVIFRQHPLSNHRNALAAARAAEAAGLQNRFWEMHDSLYRNRAVWVPALDPRPYFEAYAGYLGLDLTRFKRDLEGPEVGQRIAADQDRGASLKVDRTPVIFINGELMPFTNWPDEDIRKTIDAALKNKK